jgi:predicted kinase
VVFLAALMHDIGKPSCTRTEGGRLTSRGHSARGELMARAILWRLGTPVEERELVCGLIRLHQLPFFAIERDDAVRLALEASWVARCDLLALVTWADGAGRRCASPADQQRILDNVQLFVELCREQECLAAPRAFASDHARFEYFHTPGRDPSYAAHDDTRCEAVLMAGLPAAGKDTWLYQHAPEAIRGLPIVSLDAIRRELGVDPGEPQGRVVAAGRERARQHLRAGQGFVWNATNVTRSLRSQLVTLSRDYQARVRLVHVEAPESELRQRNLARAEPVPQRVLDRLIAKWSVPDRTEAHAVEWVVSGGT